MYMDNGLSTFKILNQNLSIVILDFVFPFISLKFALPAAHPPCVVCFHCILFEE